MASTSAVLPVDNMRVPDAMIDVVRMSGASVGTEADGAREPHRHDYHELIWVCSGTGRHLIDGVPVTFSERSVTVIGRGQVHVFEHGVAVVGAVIRFREEVLPDCGSLRWNLQDAHPRTASVPASDAEHLTAVIDALHAELRRPLDGVGLELQRHLLVTTLLLVDRFVAASRAERPSADDATAALHRRFGAQLEQDYGHHHDAAHYAAALRVPAAALSRALVAVTGRSTKQLVADRVMLEASRLLLFSDLTVGEIAHRTGFRDQLYFSRAFKRHRGASPTDYRRRHRGGGA